MASCPKLIPHCLSCENESEPLYSSPILSNRMLAFAGGRPWTIILKESALYSLGRALQHWVGRGRDSPVPNPCNAWQPAALLPQEVSVGSLGEILLVKSFLHHPMRADLWFETLEASWMKSETVPYTWRARRPKGEAILGIGRWQVQQARKLSYKACFQQPQSK